MINVLVIGSGGRENAFAWKIAQSPLLKNLFIAPGNPGCAQYGKLIDINPIDFKQIGSFCVENNIDLVLVGPELPLVNGIKDYFQNAALLKDILIVGPDAKGARLEGSKAYSKAFMEKYKIPTAKYSSFTKQTLNKGIEFLKALTPPYVIKADGLAAGKGVIITDHLFEAENTLKEIIDEHLFGESGNTVVIEEFLKGIELSVFILSDGKNYVLLPEAKDYKRIGEGDSGPNTGGMGAASPVPFADEVFMNKVRETIITPTLEGLQKEGIDYKGFIFFGLMNCFGTPYVIEYNCRMGDPETEAVIPRLKSDFLDLLIKSAKGELNNVSIEIDSLFACTIVCVAGGYPDKYEKGNVITDLDHSNTLSFHSGTALNDAGDLVTNGGRVLALTALGNNLQETVNKVNQVAEKVHWKDKYFRKDIGLDLISK